MNTNEKGELALVKVIADLTQKGYSVFLPISDYLSIDLIAVDKNMVSKRIQVKYRKSLPSGRIEVPFESVVNGKKIPVDLNNIDGYAIYVPDREQIYYIPKSELRGRQFSCTLREDSKLKSCIRFHNVDVIWNAVEDGVSS